MIPIKKNGVETMKVGNLKKSIQCTGKVPTRVPLTKAAPLLLCGYRSNGECHYANSYLAQFWSYSEADKYREWYRNLYYHHLDINRKDGGKRFGFSVRYVRD